MINCLTLSVLHGDNTDSDNVVAGMKAGGGRPSVAARTVAASSRQSSSGRRRRRGSTA